MAKARSDTAAGVLDDPATVERLDPQGMLGHIEALPEQCAAAWEQAQSFAPPPGWRHVRSLVVLGMGGSAISGDILRSLAEIAGTKPVHVVRGYELPSYVDEASLVVACSHSGYTEETLSAFEGAVEAGSLAMAVTTGGRLASMAEEHKAPVLRYEFAGVPRAAIGHQLMSLLAVAERAGVLPPQSAAVDEAVALLRQERGRIGSAVTTKDNAAKQLATRLLGRLPAVVGAGPLSSAAYRWKTQLNENSEVWALHEELPELDHNTIVGFGLPADIAARLHVIFLANRALHPRLLLRYDATAEALAEAGVSHERVDVQGTSALAQVLHAVYLGDLVSYYLALLNDVQPAQMKAIDRLKEKLAGS